MKPTLFALLVLMFCIVVANTQAQSFTVLHTFTNTPDGALPYGGLALSGNKLYGTTMRGGSGDWGTVFCVNTDGTDFTIIHNFTTNTTDGHWPVGNLVAINGKLYGVTLAGGGLGLGTVYSLNMNGTGFMLIHDFTNGTDGYYPVAGLTLVGNRLYGTVQQYYGNVFSINTDGTGFTVLHSFADGNGLYPNSCFAFSGTTLYGTTASVTNGCGTVFLIGEGGTGFNVIHRFTVNSQEGCGPGGDVVLSGNQLFGTTYKGGTNNYGVIFSMNTDGTGFRVLYNFTGYLSS